MTLKKCHRCQVDIDGTRIKYGIFEFHVGCFNEWQKEKTQHRRAETLKRLRGNLWLVRGRHAVGASIG